MYTGDLVIQVNDMDGTPLDVCANVVAELHAYLGTEDFQEVSFTFALDDKPALYLSGPDGILTGIHLHACDNYPRLASEWIQE